MKKAMSILLSLTAALVLVVGLQAEDEKKKSETLDGKICCDKCELKNGSKCATVIVVKKGDKETTYYFDKDADKKYHKEICTEAKEGKVTGVVKEEDGKKWITKVTKLEWKEDKDK